MLGGTVLVGASVVKCVGWLMWESGSGSIADIFKSNALKNGLLPIVVDRGVHCRARRVDRGRQSNNRGGALGRGTTRVHPEPWAVRGDLRDSAECLSAQSRGGS